MNDYLFLDKKTLYHSLNPAVFLILFSVLIFLAFSLLNPTHLLALALGTIGILGIARILKEWLAIYRMLFPFIVFLVLLNTIFVQSGATVLTRFSLPLLGNIRITLEALSYGLFMGLRFSILSALFSLLTYVLNPDELYGLVRRFGEKPALFILLSLRSFPLLLADYKNIIEIQEARGMDFHSRKVFSRIKTLKPVMDHLLLQSLERSLGFSESLAVRGFGANSRIVHYRKASLKESDLLVLIQSVFLVTAYVMQKSLGDNLFNFYPRMDSIEARDFFWGVIMVISLTFPAMLMEVRKIEIFADK